MIGKVILLVAMFILVMVSLGFLYKSIPQPPVNLKVSNLNSETPDIINYGSTPVFAENLRFNHNVISFRIDSGCSSEQRTSMNEALDIFHREMGVISFSEADRFENADIKISCPSNRIELGDSLFAAGEGGPSQIINTSFFKTIQEGKIFLYEPPRCDYPVVEIHELCHVFGFDHSENPDSIMYNTSRCNQRITPDMVTLIKDLYSIEPLSELTISEISSVKRGRYLDFNVTVMNEGLLPVENAGISIYADGKFSEEFYLGEINIGYARTLLASNIKLPSSKVIEVEFVVDKDNLLKEYNKKNNAVVMSV